MREGKRVIFLKTFVLNQRVFSTVSRPVRLTIYETLRGVRPVPLTLQTELFLRFVQHVRTIDHARARCQMPIEHDHVCCMTIAALYRRITPHYESLSGLCNPQFAGIWSNAEASGVSGMRVWQCSTVSRDRDQYSAKLVGRRGKKRVERKGV